MNNIYSNGKIYIIKNINDDSLVGIGSTFKTLNERFKLYKSDNKTAIGRCINKDFNNWYIELYKDYPCNCRNELELEEGKIIKEIATINKNIAGRTRKQYYIDNREKIKQYYKDRRLSKIKYQLDRYYLKKKLNN
jgi:hypothetical protein